MEVAAVTFTSSRRTSTRRPPPVGSWWWSSSSVVLFVPFGSSISTLVMKRKEKINLLESRKWRFLEKIDKSWDIKRVGIRWHATSSQHRLDGQERKKGPVLLEAGKHDHLGLIGFVFSIPIGHTFLFRERGTLIFTLDENGYQGQMCKEKVGRASLKRLSEMVANFDRQFRIFLLYYLRHSSSRLNRHKSSFLLNTYSSLFAQDILRRGTFSKKRKSV